jgi:hypothetical protein
MIGTIVGFALAGLGGRFGQLAIQKRPLFSSAFSFYTLQYLLIE